MILKTLFPVVEKRSEEIFLRFNPHLNLRSLSISIEISRILFSGIMFFRYLMSYDSAPLFLSGRPDLTLLYLLLYLFLGVGFLTPLTLLLLIVLEGTSPLFIAVKINVLFPIILFLLSAGRNFSLDGLLFKKFLQKFSFKREDFPKIRLYLLLPYALISLIAFQGHLGDETWMNLTAAQDIFLNPVVTTLPNFLRDFFRGEIGALLLKGLTLLQLIWEVTFLPFIFFPMTLLFSVSYGILFFLLSAFVIHLSFLGHLELLYFFLLFHQEFFHLLKRRVP